MSDERTQRTSGDPRTTAGPSGRAPSGRGDGSAAGTGSEAGTEVTTAMQLPDAATATPALPFARPDDGIVGGPAQPEPPATSGSGSGDDAAVRTPKPRIGPRSDTRGAKSGRRRARLGVTRVDPWSVLLISFVISLFLGVVLLVAVAVLYAMLDGLGVLASVDALAQELDLVGEGQPLFGLGRVLGVTAVLAAVDVVLLTVLATLGAFLYNLCASLTGGVEVTLTERDQAL